MSTISAVLYANQNHPELKADYPQWSDRYKQIMKKWRALSADKKAPYLQRARDNRSAQQAQARTKKAQQVRTIVSFICNQMEKKKGLEGSKGFRSIQVTTKNFSAQKKFDIELIV